MQQLKKSSYGSVLKESCRVVFPGVIRENYRYLKRSGVKESRAPKDFILPNATRSDRRKTQNPLRFLLPVVV